MANEVTASKIPGAKLAIAGKQFLRESFHQAFERIGGVNAIEDWVMQEVPIFKKNPDGSFVLDDDGEKIVIRTERRRNDEHFAQLLSLMARLEPKEVNVKDDRSIESTIEAIEAEFTDVSDE